MNATARHCVATLAAAVLVAGCSIGDRAARSEAVIDAADLVAKEGTTRGRITVTETRSPRDFRSSSGDVLQSTVVEQSDEIAYDFVLDYTNLLAVYTDVDAPVAVFDGTRVYGTREGINERDARPWMRIELGDRDQKTQLDLQNGSGLAFARGIHPAVLVDLMAGPLSGSIDDPVVETVDDVELLRYEARIDLEKVLKRTRRDDYDEDRQAAYEVAFRQLAVSGTLYDARVWLRPDGLPAAFEIDFELHRPQPNIDVTLTVRIDFADFGTPVEITIPTEDDYLETEDLLSFIGATFPSRGVEAAPAPESIEPGDAAIVVGGDTSEQGAGSS